MGFLKYFTDFDWEGGCCRNFLVWVFWDFDEFSETKTVEHPATVSHVCFADGPRVVTPGENASENVEHASEGFFETRAERIGFL